MHLCVDRPGESQEAMDGKKSDYPQDCEACPDASLFTVGSMDAPCWLLYHGPIVTVNFMQ